MKSTMACDLTKPKPCCGLPPRVIINADDLGYSAATNKAIFDLMAEGRITSATIMANGQAVFEAAQRCKGFPQCSFGVHLCLTELSPVSQAGRELPFVDSQGNFDSSRFAASRPSRAVHHRIFLEWCEQIQLLRGLGVPVSHIDSHNHVHTRPWLFPVLKRVQAATGIRKVRASLNLYLERKHRAGRWLLVKKRLFNALLRFCYRTSTTDVFTHYEWFSELRSTTNWKGRSLELMTHPGSVNYRNETQLLRSADFELLRPLLISYNDL